MRLAPGGGGVRAEPRLFQLLQPVPCSPDLMERSVSTVLQTRISTDPAQTARLSRNIALSTSDTQASSQPQARRTAATMPPARSRGAGPRRAHAAALLLLALAAAAQAQRPSVTCSEMQGCKGCRRFQGCLAW